MRTLLAFAAVASMIATVQAQRGGPPAPQTPRLAAPFDLTGIWTSLVTEDWRYRMVTPPKGDVTSIPLSPAGRKLAGSWDPVRDEAAGEQCRGREPKKVAELATRYLCFLLAVVGEIVLMRRRGDTHVILVRQDSFDRVVQF